VPLPSILPSAQEIRTAAARLGGSVVHTPLVASPALSRAAGGEVLLKLESAQTGGSFKLRGALNALLTLTDEERQRGIVASSAGNHGLGIAIAAERLGIEATVFVPAGAAAVKRAGIVAHGARVDATQPDYDAAERAARSFALASGASFVSPCTGRSLLAGAGTVALEVLADAPSLRTIVVPVGGGGLAGGVGGLLREVAPEVRILGAQGVRTNAMSLAIAAGAPTGIPGIPGIPGTPGIPGLTRVVLPSCQQLRMSMIGAISCSSCNCVISVVSS
jgi:threonine dehydratase